MKCCNLKNLCYISASLQLAVFSVLIIVLILFLLIIGNLDESIGISWALALISLVFSILYCVLFIILLVGLKQNRILLVSIFLYGTHTILAIGIVYMIYELIMEFVNKEPVGDILLKLLIECSTIGLELLLTTPIQMLHKRMHIKTSGDEETAAKEAGDLSTDLEGNI